MEKSTFRQYFIWGQLVAWAILFMINFMEELEYESLGNAFLFSVTYIAYLVPTVYIHYYWLLPLFSKGKKWIYFIATFLLITFFLLIYDVIYYCIPTNYPEEFEIGQEFFYHFLLTTIITGGFSLVYFAEAWFEHFKKATLLRSEKLEAELNFLKSQINPHFLFNTLNNIYAYAQTGNEKTAPMLERLSTILRFMVYDCSEERVILNKEIAAVEDLLEIHKMKNSRQQNIQFLQEGVKGYHLIAPLIIVNFVENACKHSDTVSNPNGFIKISIAVDESDNCVFEIINSAKEKNSIDGKYQGVGLQNIKKRLELQYGENYEFLEEKVEAIYRMQLSIPLERKK